MILLSFFLNRNLLEYINVFDSGIQNMLHIQLRNILSMSK